MITANVDSVTVDVSKTSIKFSFPEDNLSMSATETIKLINNGVGTASYKWIVNDSSKLFTVDKKEGKVGGANVNCSIGTSSIDDRCLNYLYSFEYHERPRGPGK